MTLDKYEMHDYDVIVVGGGGAGLRAAIEASAQGVRTALICKSLLGKAHTVMAEGGIAAALGNMWPEDNWQVHFRDTMRGGKMLCNWRMAQLHAQEAPARVLELEAGGALFDRTKDGRILQRDFGGHRYARLAHVGDRTEQVHVARPARHDVQVHVVGQARPRTAPDVEADVEPLRLDRPSQNRLQVAGDPHHLQQRCVVQRRQLTHVGQRRDQRMPAGVGKAVEHRNRSLAPPQDEVLSLAAGGIAGVADKAPLRPGR